MSPRITHLGWIALSVAPLVLGTRSALAEPSAVLNVIRFKASTSNDTGLVRCAIFAEQGWLKQPVQSAVASIHGKVALCVFRGIPRGIYGISAFHDENKNGKLDTNFIGYPVEEYCASKNARNAFSAPSFSDARFRYSGGNVDLEARMK